MLEASSYDYRDGLDFYEQCRASLIARTGPIRAYANGAAIIQNSGVLYFLDKFKRKGPISPRNHGTGMKTEDSFSRYALHGADVQELVHILAGMMRSAGELHGTSKHKDYT